MDSTDTVDLTPVEPPATARRSRWRTIGVLVVLVLAIVALLSQGLLHSLNYFKTVDEVLANRQAVGTSEIRLEGVVQSHTITRTSSGASFYVGSGDKRIFVIVNGTPPQLFQANIPVVVVGHFSSSHSLIFEGSQIMVKHTASYIAQHPSRVRAPNGSVR